MLMKSTLVNGVKVFLEKHPSSIVESAQKFANALGAYSMSIQPPSVSVELAKTAFIGIFTTITNEPANGNTLLPQALQQFCIVLGSGMLPAFTPTPPIWSGTEFNGLKKIGVDDNGSADKCANEFADIVHDKFKKGQAINVVTGATIFWS